MKVALVEFSENHSECLFSQALFLQDASITYVIICNRKLQQELEALEGLDAHYFDYPAHSGGKFRAFWKIRGFILKGKFDRVILNTAQSGPAKWFCLIPFPRKVRFFGILHNLEKLRNSFGQKIISLKLSGYFVLNDRLLKSLRSGKGNFQSFYPIFFPSVKSVYPEKKNDEIWICIPGEVSFKRRDYAALFASLDFDKPIENVKFILLGRILGHTKPIIDEYSQHPNFPQMIKLYRGFVPFQEFHSIVNASDLIMPLIHPKEDQTYMNSKTSGSINLALAYQKPLLAHSYWKNCEDFQGIFYDPSNLQETLAALQIPVMKITNSPRLKFENQKNRYIKFIKHQ